MWSRHSRAPLWTPTYADDCREVDVGFGSRCTASEMTTNWVRSDSGGSTTFSLGQWGGPWFLVGGIQPCPPLYPPLRLDVERKWPAAALQMVHSDWEIHSFHGSYFSARCSGSSRSFTLGGQWGAWFWAEGHSTGTTTGLLLRTILCKSLVLMHRVKFVEKYTKHAC